RHARQNQLQLAQSTTLPPLAHQLQYLLLYHSADPYREPAAHLSSLIHLPLGNVQPTITAVRIAGVVMTLRTQTSRRGKMGFVTLDDGKDTAEIVIYNETFDAHRHLLREDVLLVAEVRVQQRMNEEGQVQGLRIVADAVYDLPAARRKFARGLKLRCNGSASGER